MSKRQEWEPRPALGHTPRPSNNGSADSPSSHVPMGRERAAPRSVTAKSLENAALYYLQRYSASTERLRRVLRRRVVRARFAGQPGLDVDTAHDWIEAIIARLHRAGLLDDARHAETRALSLAHRGESRTLITRRLLAEGVAPETIQGALQTVADDAPGPVDPDLAAAATLARRRRLGPYRTDAAERAARRERDLAALARKGFSARIARMVIDAPDPDTLEADLSGA